MPSDPRLAFLQAAAEWVATASNPTVRAPARAELALACARLGHVRLAWGLAFPALEEASAAKEGEALTRLAVGLAYERMGDRDESARLFREVERLVAASRGSDVPLAAIALVREERGPGGKPDPLARRLLEATSSLETRSRAHLLGRCASVLAELGLGEVLAREARVLLGADEARLVDPSREGRLPILQAQSLARALEVAEGSDRVRPEDAIWGEEVLLFHDGALEPLDLPFVRFVLRRDPPGADARADRMEKVFLIEKKESNALLVALTRFEEVVAKGELEEARALYEPLAARARALRPWDQQMRFSVALTSHAPEVLDAAGASHAILVLVALGRTAYLRGDLSLASDFFSCVARTAVQLERREDAKALLLELVASLRDMREESKRRPGCVLAALATAARSARTLGDGAWGQEYLRKLVSVLEARLDDPRGVAGPEKKRGRAALVERNKARASGAKLEPGEIAYDSTPFFARDGLAHCARAALGLGHVDDGRRWLETVLQRPSPVPYDNTTVLGEVLGACSEEVLDDATRFELATRALASLGGEPTLLACPETVAGIVFVATGVVSSTEAILARRLRGLAAP